MEKPALKVVVRVEPPQELSRAVLDELMSGELHAFEQDLIQKTKEKNLTGGPLTSPERGILKAYLFYAYTRKA